MARLGPRYPHFALPPKTTQNHLGCGYIDTFRPVNQLEHYVDTDRRRHDQGPGLGVRVCPG